MTDEFEVRDLTSVAREVGELLKERDQTVAVSESAAGGLISAALLSIPGSSAYFAGGGVIYTRAARRALLKFSKAQSEMRGSTEEYALLAAQAIRERLGTTWGLAESGAAGPSGNRYGDNAGHACFAVAGPLQRVMTIDTENDDRIVNMWAFAQAAIELLEESINAFSGLLMVYGISNCDTCRKAIKWLEKQDIEFRFHDFHTEGLEATTLNEWISDLSWQTLLNRRSTTWRQLPEAVRKNANPATVAALMLANPTLIKRPVFEYGERRWVGFGDDQRKALRKLK